jgi:cell fate (sporulation/competence/biofilm development) regulator YlbF (YheA/YmcA/DUF963 family)
MSTLEEKATELGRIVGQSGEYQAVKRANDALTEDREAVAVLKQMEKLRVDAQQMIERGEQPGPDMEAELEGLLGQVQGNAHYQNMVIAQENFEKVMLRVNEWILEGIRKGAASPIITLS